MNWLVLWIDFWATLLNVVVNPRSDETKKLMKELNDND